MLSALALRDVITRFGTGLFSVAVTAGWPIVHAGIIFGAYYFMNVGALYGTNSFYWVLSGALPFVIFIYPLRWVGTSIQQGQALLSFPAVKSIDLIVGRVISEFALMAVSVISLFCFVGAISGYIEIANFSSLISAIFATFYYGISFGVIIAPIMAVFPFAFLIIIFVQITSWASSGVLFLPDSIPDPFHYYLSFNPLIHGVEWFRVGLFEDYHSNMLDRSYLISVSSFMLALGLLFDRFRR